VRHFIRNLVSLTKFYLSAAVAFSALAGYFIFAGGFYGQGVVAVLGVFLMAAAAGTLNQVQERKRDALMERTRKRPLPSGWISPVKALVVSALMLVSGFLVLFTGFGSLAALLGLGNLIWYNWVYTPLKTRSYFAVLVGAINGAIPPVIGWTAAGGSIWDPKILFISFFIFLWQVPHFLLLLTIHGTDYEKAGFYSITSGFRFPVVRNILLVWITATSLSTLFLLRFHIITTLPLIIILMTATVILLVFFFTDLVTGESPPRIKHFFIVFNLFMVMVFAIILAEGLTK